MLENMCKFQHFFFYFNLVYRAYFLILISATRMIKTVAYVRPSSVIKMSIISDFAAAIVVPMLAAKLNTVDSGVRITSPLFWLVPHLMLELPMFHLLPRKHLSASLIVSC